MPQLIVHTTRQGETFRTGWWTGAKEGASGVLTSRVTDPVVPEDLKIVVAELDAMHALIQAGRVGCHGGAKGLRLVFSQPLIGAFAGQDPPILQVRDARYSVVPYGYFLLTRFYTAEISLDEAGQWVNGRCFKDLHDLGALETPRDSSVETPIGRVFVTHWALRQYLAKSGTAPGNGWANLSRVLRGLSKTPRQRSEHDASALYRSGGWGFWVRPVERHRALSPGCPFFIRTVWKIPTQAQQAARSRAAECTAVGGA